MKANLSIVYYSANYINDFFADNVRKQLLNVAKNTLPIISVTQKPINFGKNICCGEIGRSHLNIYRQATRGALEAITKYIAFCEDDVFYSEEHFNYLPNKTPFIYDENMWNIYTWTKPPLFSWKGRKNMNGLICDREEFIRAMEERFAKYPIDEEVPLHLWAEPGKYERQLGVKVNSWEFYQPKEASVVFSHPAELSFEGLGTRKRLGEKRIENLEPWGKASDFVKFYK